MQAVAKNPHDTLVSNKFLRRSSRLTGSSDYLFLEYKLDIYIYIY